MRIFQLTPEVAAISSPLAANQGLYNGFLAAGLIWGLVAGVSELVLQVFFLVCVVIAGVFGSITAKRSILWYQALPAAVALALVAVAHAR
jgi:putative membrane protein